jgi:hypothetical protein
MHLLNTRAPLLSSEALEPARERKEIMVDPELLDRYVGRYQFPTLQKATVTRQSGHLLLQGEGEVRIEFYPESPRDFFAKIMDAQITFETDPQGRIMELLFSRSGSVQHVQRIE